MTTTSAVHPAAHGKAIIASEGSFISQKVAASACRSGHARRTLQRQRRRRRSRARMDFDAERSARREIYNSRQPTTHQSELAAGRNSLGASSTVANVRGSNTIAVKSVSIHIGKIELDVSTVSLQTSSQTLQTLEILPTFFAEIYLRAKNYIGLKITILIHFFSQGIFIDLKEIDTNVFIVLLKTSS